MPAPYREPSGKPPDNEPRADRAVVFDMIIFLLFLVLGAVVVRSVWALGGASPISILRRM